MPQNLFDREDFFTDYKKHRYAETSANRLFEMPALFSLLPDLEGKTVLDMGCGFGDHSMEYIRRGADRVVGIDISERMLEAARKENADPKIEYLKLPMEELDQLEGQFDLAVSSLAVHYVEDFSKLVSDVFKLLKDDGIFLFSQENPIITCRSNDIKRWTRGEHTSRAYWNLANYGVEGEREFQWISVNAIKYHRTFSTILNTLISAGFTIEKILEPLPEEEMLKEYPMYRYLYHRPDYLIVRAGKHRQETR